MRRRRQSRAAVYLTAQKNTTQFVVDKSKTSTRARVWYQQPFEHKTQIPYQRATTTQDRHRRISVYKHARVFWRFTTARTMSFCLLVVVVVVVILFADEKLIEF